MKSGGMAGQIARWATLGALFLIPFAPLMVANSYFFPFITGKAFYLRILIEIAVAGWVVLAFLNKEYRPRKSWIGIVAVCFVAWMFIADVFALNSLKAFWSNFERMEGWVLLIHLLGLFFAASAVLRAEKKWRAWFLTSLGVSLIISFYALLQLGGSLAIHQGSTRIDATLGNSAYLAIYFLFSVFVALWLALTEKRSWLKWSLIALATLETILIFFTETRGTIIGLVLGFSLAALLTMLTANARARRFAAGGLVLIVVLVGSLYLARDSSFVQNNSTLQRITSISLADGKVRFTIWKMAAQGVVERPILGWGQEGFNYVFNKYYDPSLYTQEQWFDRAHNAFIDWLSAGGIPAFLLYLSLFGSALFLLWRSSELSRSERILLTSALVGYGIHNFFVFDNLYSYVYFFAILALIDSQVARPIKKFEEAPEITPVSGTTYALPVAAVLCIAVMWFVNGTGMQASSKLIAALSTNNPDVATTYFEEFSARPVFAMQEVREQLISFASAVVQSEGTTIEQKQRVASLALIEMQRQIEEYPLDAREYVQLSYLYRVIGDNKNALKALEEALKLSPKKEMFLIEKGTVEWNMGDVQAAQESFSHAYALGPKFENLALYAAAGHIAAGDQAAAEKILTDRFGTVDIDNDLLATAYYRTKNWPRLIALLKLRTEAPDAGVNAWFSLASIYQESGDSWNAVKTINAAIERYPEAASAGAEAIKQLQGQ
jgi:O-antigen ligase/Tfp pilus assembly protein PilF